MIQNRLKALPGYSLYQRVADKARKRQRFLSRRSCRIFYDAILFTVYHVFAFSASLHSDHGK